MVEITAKTGIPPHVAVPPLPPDGRPRRLLRLFVLLGGVVTTPLDSGSGAEDVYLIEFVRCIVAA